MALFFYSFMQWVDKESKYNATEIQEGIQYHSSTDGLNRLGECSGIETDLTMFHM